MKITFIQPSQLDDNGKPLKYKQLLLPSGTLSLLAGLTPAHIEVEIVNDYIDDINYDDNVDLIALTSLTLQAPRAYQIAMKFRKRKVPVIMGGIHATALPEEVSQYADSVFIGEAEGLWEQVVLDFEKTRKLEKMYKPDHYPDLQKLTIPRFDLSERDKCIKALNAKSPAIPIACTRGCPFKCDYCSVTRFFGATFRTKPIDNILAEIEASGADDFFFIDDNMIGNPKFAEQLFKELIPLKKRWFTQFSTTALKHPHLVELAGEAGCHEVMLGIESINPKNLASVNKKFNNPDDYQELFKLLKQNKISPHVMVMFGFDEDDVSLIHKTVDFFMESEVNFMRIFFLTPFFGTKIYDVLEKEGRITERDWSKYDANHVIVKPKKMTAEEMTEAVWKAYDKFYSAGNVLKRLWKFRSFYSKNDYKGSFLDDVLFQFHFNRSIKKRKDPWSGL